MKKHRNGSMKPLHGCMTDWSQSVNRSERPAFRTKPFEQITAVCCTKNDIDECLSRNQPRTSTCAIKMPVKHDTDIPICKAAISPSSSPKIGTKMSCVHEINIKVLRGPSGASRDSKGRNVQTDQHTLLVGDLALQMNGPTEMRALPKGAKACIIMRQHLRHPCASLG